jgi:hypothetical protein
VLLATLLFCAFVGKEWTVSIKSGIKRTRKGKILMNKHVLRILCLALGLLFAGPGYAAANEIIWQLNWLEDGRLYEQVQVPADINNVPAGTDWKLTQEGNLVTYSREITDWNAYQSQKEGLPLKIEQKNYYYCQKTSILTNEQYASVWFSQLSRANGLQLILQVPGLIFAGSADEQAAPTAIWHFTQGTDLLAKGLLMNVVQIDGLLMGITVVGLGLILGGGIFFRRLRKVDEIIAEEYGLPRHTNNPPKED